MENETKDATVAEVIRSIVRRRGWDADTLGRMLGMPRKDAVEAERCIKDCRLEGEEAIEYLCEAYCDCVAAFPRPRMI
jgi:hypothetical protein